MLYNYQTWSEEPLMQVYDDDDLHQQRSSIIVIYVLWLPTWSEKPLM